MSSIQGLSVYLSALKIQGQGATFEVQLPVLNSSNRSNFPSSTSPSVQGESQRSPSSSPLVGLRILVADDDPDSCDIAAFILRQAGAEVIAVSSASEALRILQTTEIDLLLSDIGMPEMNGYELMREVRQRLEKPSEQISTTLKQVNLPAIALTAYAEEDDRQQALASGFQWHLIKPVEPDELIRTIRTATGRG